MAEAEFPVQGIQQERERLDLSNAINGVSGVAGVVIDAAGTTIRVEYDPRFADRDILAAAISGSGYPLRGESA